MARCGCSGTSCSCVVVGGTSVTVTGSGSAANPYVITGGGALTTSDTPTVDMSLSGNGQVATPYLLSAEATLDLQDIQDVDVSSQTAGKVLTVNPTNDGYIFAAAPTATPGVINTTNAVSGDGSVGDPLRIDLDPAGSGLSQTSAGLKVNGAGGSISYTPTWTATTNPAVGNGTISGRYIQFLNLCWVNIEIIFGSTTTRGSGIWSIGMPPGVLPVPGTVQMLRVGITLPNATAYEGFATVFGSAATTNIFISGGATAAKLTNAYPVSLPSNSRLILTGLYEVDM